MNRLWAIVLLAGCTGTPVRERLIDAAVRDGIAYLLSAQNADGSWGSGQNSSGFDVLADVPGSHDAFRVGATALCVLALFEAGEPAAALRGAEFLAGTDFVRRANRAEIYNVWAHTYALQALVLTHRKSPSPDRTFFKAAARELRNLARYETFLGGWNYYDFVYGTRTPSMEPTSFGTAAALVALRSAKTIDLPVPEGLTRRALARLREMRNPDGSFLYGSDFRYNPMHLANRGKGSLGRTQSCHFAMVLWEEKGIGESELREGLDRFFRDHRFMDIGRKRQFPHEAWYFTSGYYYYFGHYYAALLIERLDDNAYRAELPKHVLPYQEADGSWWDYRMWGYHKPYGTAFAIMTLLRCR